MKQFAGRLFAGRLFAGRLWRDRQTLPPSGGMFARPRAVDQTRRKRTRRQIEDEELLFLLGR